MNSLPSDQTQMDEWSEETWQQVKIFIEKTILGIDKKVQN